MSNEENKNLNEEIKGETEAKDENYVEVDQVEEVEKIVIEDEKNEEKAEKVIDENPSIGKRIFASFLDQAILFGISALVVVLFGLIIRIFGYMIVLPTPMLLVAYIVLNILYFPVFESGKGRTIGKRILGIL